ncbi:MAG: glycosyltransferase [Gammaproteobacteria bacterium]|nr:glycosyltransferase [Gammaproteobacteria bacterium]
MTALLLLLAAPAVLACAYLLGLTLLSAPLPVPAGRARTLRFDVVVPAHNEAAGIARTVTSALRLDWPTDRFRVLVVADNCDDATADAARAAGATVLVRTDPARRGKGYALAHAFAASATDAWADALLVIDADSEISANLLAACAARLGDGAAAVQVHYGVLNPMAAWRTRLITIAKGAFHILRSRARERLGVSAGIRGNGWCITHELLHRVPFRSYSLAEDLEYGIALGLAGVRVHYADEAHANGEMVTRAAAAGTQRRRWERGRFGLIRAQALPLLRAGLTRPSAICLDLACDLLVLPLSYVVLNVLALAGLALLLQWLGHPAAAWLSLSLVCALSLALYVLRGWQLSGVGWRGLLDLAAAPFYLAWKLAVMLRPGGSSWVRTERERP